jgi:alanine dehydrogenase
MDALSALLLTEDDVRAVMAEPGATVSAVDALERAIAAFARGEVSSSPRVHVGEGGERSGRALRVLPSGTACRIYTMNKEAGPGAPAPCELIVLFDEAMALRAIVEDYSLHSLRTGAPSAVAVRHLAPEHVRTIAVIGSGRQARGQLAAVASVRPPERVLVYSPDAGRCEAFAEEMGATAVAGVEEAVREAEIVLVATNTATPVLERRWLAPGALVVSIAPCELAPSVVLDARLVPFSTEELLAGTPRWEPICTLVEHGDLERSALDVEVGDLVAGTRTLHRTRGEVTVVLSAGMAYWDAAIADWVDTRARALGLGRPLFDGGGTRTGRGFAAPRLDLPIYSDS